MTNTIQEFDLPEVINKHLIIAITCKRGIITYVNNAFVELSQYSQNELLGKTHKTINSGTHSDAFFKNIWNEISSGQTWQGEICNRKKNGQLYWVQTTIVPRIDDKGEIKAFISLRTDITSSIALREKIKQQSYIESTLKNILEVIITDNSSQKIENEIKQIFNTLWPNSGFDIYTKHQETERFEPLASHKLSITFNQLLTKISLLDNLSSIEELLEKTPYFYFDNPHFHPYECDGVNIINESNVHSFIIIPIKNNGKILGIFSVYNFNMISEVEIESEIKLSLQIANLFSVKLAQQIAVSNRLRVQNQLIQSEKLNTIKNMVRSIAHEFNNSLTSVLGYADLIFVRHQNEIPKTAVTYLNRITQAGESAKHLVSKLIEYSENKKGEKRIVNVISFIEELIILQQKNEDAITFSFVIKCINVHVSVDPVQLYQAVSAIVSNAVDEIKKEDKTSIHKITFVVEKVEFIQSECISCSQIFKGKWVKISIIDSAQPIPESIVNKILTPFYTTKSLSEGSGMGLAIVDKTIHEAGGHIQIISGSDDNAEKSIDLFLPSVPHNLQVTVKDII
jgi:PAS domain S-box-containing protein